MATMQIGDEVTVSRHLHRFGWEKLPGKVTKVGRKYATATYQRTRTNWHNEPETVDVTVEFDMTTGFEKGDQYGNGYRVRTPEQEAAEQRRAAALTVLRDAGVDVTARSSLTGEQIEALAATVASFTGSADA
jgi:hypothetical protein